MSKWHPREHRKALDGMLVLTLEEKGAYTVCLDLIYEREGPIPDDARWLSGWMGVSSRKWSSIRASLIAKAKLFAVVVNGVPSLMNQRAAIEIENQSQRARILSENGAKGGRTPSEPKANDNKNNGETQAPLKPITLTSTETDTEETDDGDAREPDWDARLEEAKAAGGDALDLTQAALWTYRDLRALCEPRSGEPCEWGEVLDAIRFRAAKVAAQSSAKIRSWTWVKDQALAYRDRRLAGLRTPQAVATGPPSSIAAQIAIDNAESERRAFEMLDAPNGRTN